LAIEEITKTSKETGKVIKTIDEIVFQTKMLALCGEIRINKGLGKTPNPLFIFFDGSLVHYFAIGATRI
jgi:hypothetical protein